MRSNCVLFVRNLFGLLAFLCVFSSAAATTNVGDLTNNSYVNAFSIAHGTSSFQDVFQFNLSADSTFNAIASEVVVPSFFNISNFSMSLSTPGGSSYVFGPASPVVGPTLLTLAQGNNYTLSVSGVADGAFGGSYSILLAAAAVADVLSPVPEPGQWLMLLAGLLLIGSKSVWRGRIGNPAA